MGLYSDAILKQMGRIGEPVRTKATTTVKPPGPAIDLMQMLMMLIFSGAFQQGPKETLGVTPTPAPRDLSALPPAPATMASTPFAPTGGMGGMGGGNLASLMKILMNIPGMGGMSGM